ncbi:heterokaryon incompatibility protein-domain-containing protein [Staphylotrichum tortipilum]|uniref:Heterokaryon incompatibility protein-domain-containing protein n=1 Tax=Staphylotrichum tortipilum TaxID=2831512 RepID=A0AAN6RWZ2_9PEZI|nr:heterokaryon incompatibility protein-domain-containing protein [Staphylotrichum longicolle]
MARPVLTQSYNPYDAGLVGKSNPEFRLLELLPGAQGEQLRGHLSVAEIAASAQQFKALSYAWGSGSELCAILIVPPAGRPVEPHAVAITESLHTALIHLRDAEKPVRLWIDQICINQNNPEEKGAQVRLMGSIYAQAEQVLVWLGPSADESDSLMDAWGVVGQAAWDFGLEGYYTRERWPDLHRMINSPDPSNPKHADVLQHWFARPWFSRAWIVQEFCLCADTVFLCGTKSVPVEIVMLAIQLLRYAMGQLFTLFHAAVPLALLSETSDEPTSRLFSCRQRRRKLDRSDPDAEGDQLHALLRKLYVGRDTQVTLHRDRIFSLLFLAVDGPALEGLEPDYTHQTSPADDARILAAAARAMITNPATGRVDILCLAQFPKAPALAEAGLPSWAPDWRGNLRPSFYVRHEAVASPHLFAACGVHTAVKPLPGPDDEPSVLGLAGYKVDTVESVAPGEPWEDMAWDAVRFAGFFAQVDGLFELASRKALPRFYASEERRAEARWRVPVGDLYWTSAGGMQRLQNEGRVYHVQCWESVQLLAEGAVLSEEEGARRLREWGWKEKLERGEIGSEYRSSMEYVIGKKPFLTKEGYLGMGPAGVEVGDMVVVFCGGRIPFVLRPKEDGLVVPVNETGERERKLFEYIGEAYCDGVMDGEAVETGMLDEFYLA